jgi:hypothetical protein
LDALVSRLPNGSLTHQVYRKNTHIDRYLHAQSHHHLAQNSAVLITLISGANHIFAPQFIDQENTHLTKAFVSNGYSISEINKAFHSTRKPNAKISPSSSPQALISLPYI